MTSTAEERNTLHAIVVERPNGLLEAQLIEIDIAVAGRTEDQLLDELAHAITLEYHIAKQHHKTPFANLTQAPDDFTRGRSQNQFVEWGTLTLESEVVEALATALHAPEPEIKVMSLRNAA